MAMNTGEAIQEEGDLFGSAVDAAARVMSKASGVRLVLCASSSARDTDFSAKVVDVYPDGRAISLRSDMVHARFRDSFAEPSFLDNGDFYECDIMVGSTSNVFSKGHKIRLEVSSSYLPEFGRNLNTSVEVGMISEMMKAEQTVYYDSEHRPSYPADYNRDELTDVPRPRLSCNLRRQRTVSISSSFFLNGEGRGCEKVSREQQPPCIITPLGGQVEATKVSVGRRRRCKSKKMNPGQTPLLEAKRDLK